MKDLHIRIVEVKEIPTKDGRKFTVYKSLTKDGKLMDNAYFDIAAWAAFPNLASAKAFDLKAAAK